MCHERFPDGNDVDLKTGPGSDHVDASASMTGVRVALGPGADEFIGGPMRDGVDATAPDLAPDRVTTAGDVDFVTTDGGDTIDLGPGADFLSDRGEATGAKVTGGRGRDSFGLSLMRRGPHAWKLNNGTRRLTRDGALVARTYDFSHFGVALRGTFTFVGSQDREALLVWAGKHWAPGHPVHAHMRGGNDTVMLEGAESLRRSSAGGQFDGGSGVDMFRYQRYESERPVPTTILFDMQSGLLRDSWPSVWPGIWDGGMRTRQAINFENADVRNLDRKKANVYGTGPVTIRGTNGPNRLHVWTSGLGPTRPRPCSAEQVTTSSRAPTAPTCSLEDKEPTSREGTVESTTAKPKSSTTATHRTSSPPAPRLNTTRAT